MSRSLRLIGGSALALALLLALAAQWPRSGAAATQKRVQLEVARKDRPVVITEVTLGTVQVQAGRFVRAEGVDPITPFDAWDDWIQNLTIYLLNRTDKTIVYALVRLSFPETTVSRTRRMCELRLGQVPEAAAFDKNGNLHLKPGSQPLSFGPGETMAIHLSDYMDQIRSRVESSPSALPLAAMTQLNIAVDLCYFQDGMVWAGQDFAMPLKQTRTWQRMDRNYFPGDMNMNWPGQGGRTELERGKIQ